MTKGGKERGRERRWVGKGREGRKRKGGKDPVISAKFTPMNTS